ncbi:MAG: hypothetical protein QM817_24820 [Archangium sp.]
MLLALVLASAPLTDATRAYADLEYEACVSALSGLKGVPAGERAKAELLLGLCHFALGHEKKASASISSALRRDPNVAAPANASPKEVAFIDVQRKSPAPAPAPRVKPDKPNVEVAKTEDPPKVEEQPAPIEPPPPAAPSEVLTPTSTPLPAAVDAAMPANTVVAAPKATWLPWVTGGVAVAAAGLGTGLGLNASALEAKGRAEPVQLESARFATAAQTNATGANVAFAVAGTAAIGTIVAIILTR